MLMQGTHIQTGNWEEGLLRRSLQWEKDAGGGGGVGMVMRGEKAKIHYKNV